MLALMRYRGLVGGEAVLGRAVGEEAAVVVGPERARERLDALVRAGDDHRALPAGKHLLEHARQRLLERGGRQLVEADLAQPPASS